MIAHIVVIVIGIVVMMMLLLSMMMMLRTGVNHAIRINTVLWPRLVVVVAVGPMFLLDDRVRVHLLFGRRWWLFNCV